MPDHDDSWFGDLNRDGREDWRDDMLGMWLVGETLRLQRERRELQEKLERERRERVQERLWQTLSADRRRTRDDDDDDDDDDFIPLDLSRHTAPPSAITRPAPPTATEPPAPQPAAPQPPAKPFHLPWFGWVIVGLIGLVIVFGLSEGLSFEIAFLLCLGLVGLVIALGRLGGD